MAKTVLAGKKIVKFSFKNILAALALVAAKSGKLPKNFFMRDRPGYACNWNG